MYGAYNRLALLRQKIRALVIAPSPLAGEGSSEFQYDGSGEGARLHPSPSRGCWEASAALSRRARGHSSNRRASWPCRVTVSDAVVLGVSSRRVLLGLAGSVSLAALTAVGAVLAQEETTLPEIRVIAPTPVPASPRRPARPTPAPATRQTRTQTPAPAPARVAAPPTPEPALIDRDKVPSTTQTLTSQEFQPWAAPTVTDALTRVVPSVSTSDTAVNPFQPDLTYRGFLASPTVGTPQGLAIYQNGVRINEAFGDTVNWDFIPERAIRRLDVSPSNPVFGLNAIGGAISIEMKHGFNSTGREIEGVVR